MKRKEDKYDSNDALKIAQSLFNDHQTTVSQMATEAAIDTMERAYRAGYTKALIDHGIEVYPQNITSRQTIEVEDNE